jgi:hypothetical protein
MGKVVKVPPHRRNGKMVRGYTREVSGSLKAKLQSRYKDKSDEAHRRHHNWTVAGAGIVGLISSSRYMRKQNKIDYHKYYKPLRQKGYSHESLSKALYGNKFSGRRYRKMYDKGK